MPRAPSAGAASTTSDAGSTPACRASTAAARRPGCHRCRRGTAGRRRRRTAATQHGCSQSGNSGSGTIMPEKNDHRRGHHHDAVAGDRPQQRDVDQRRDRAATARATATSVAANGSPAAAAAARDATRGGRRAVTRTSRTRPSAPRAGASARCAARPRGEPQRVEIERPRQLVRDGARADHGRGCRGRRSTAASRTAPGRATRRSRPAPASSAAPRPTAVERLVDHDQQDAQNRSASTPRRSPRRGTAAACGSARRRSRGTGASRPSRARPPAARRAAR